MNFTLNIVGKKLIKKQTLIELFSQLHKININAIISLKFIKNKQIKLLNTKWRNKNYATDVLAFERLNKNFGLNTKEIGDLIISIEYAEEQAEIYKHSILEEICYLFIHGLTHLLGYNHEKGIKYEKAQLKAEIFLLKKIKINPKLAFLHRK